MKDWADCKNILCIRADNMGDVLMSSPAIGALSAGLGCRITLLTSDKGAEIAEMIPTIDQVITFNMPWVKLDKCERPDQIFELVKDLKSHAFDGCVIFTVYSQNPMPAIMLAYLAEIPLRLSYCRENPYHLLTHWLPDREPYELIKHQVQRDLDLVAHIGMFIDDKHLKLTLPAPKNLAAALALKGLDTDQSYLVLHPGVSEVKRSYAFENWVDIGRLLSKQGFRLLITGSPEETELVNALCHAIGKDAISLGGKLSVAEFAFVISKARVVISVNTGTIHLAAALGTPVVVLYAMSNPQHTPWMVPCRVLPYQVAEEHRSKNKVVEHVDRIYNFNLPQPGALSVTEAVSSLLKPEE